MSSLLPTPLFRENSLKLLKNLPPSKAHSSAPCDCDVALVFTQKAPGLGAELLEVVAYCEGGQIRPLSRPHHCRRSRYKIGFPLGLID